MLSPCVLRKKGKCFMLKIKTSKKNISDIRYVVEEVAKFDASNVQGLDQLQELQPDVFFNPVTEEIYGYNYQAALAVANSMILANSDNGAEKINAFMDKVAGNSFESDNAMLAAGRANGGNTLYYNYLVNVDQLIVNPKYIWKASFNNKDIKYTRYEVIEQVGSFAVGKPAKGKTVMFNLDNLNVVIRNTVFSTSLLELVESVLQYINDKINDKIRNTELLRLTNVLAYLFVNMTGGLHNIVKSQYEEDLRAFMTDIFVRAQSIFDNAKKAAEDKAAAKAAKEAEKEAKKAEKEAKAVEKAKKEAEKAVKKAEREAKKEAKATAKAEKEAKALEEAGEVIKKAIEMTKEEDQESVTDEQSAMQEKKTDIVQDDPNVTYITEDDELLPFMAGGTVRRL